MSQPTETNQTTPQCPLCHIEIKSLGQVPVRTGGTTGACHFLFGGWADLGEGIILLDAYCCPRCSRLEFYDHDFSLPNN